MSRRKKPAPLQAAWGRHRKGALRHVWVDYVGSYRDADGGWVACDRRTACGAVAIPGHERPSRRGRACRKCAASTVDPRAAIGRMLAFRWPRAATGGKIRSMAPSALKGDRLEEVIRSMAADGLVTENEVYGRSVWTARRALVERHGRVYGW